MHAVEKHERTLDHWRSKLEGLPRIIDCPKMELLGRDTERNVFVGPGRIEIKSPTDFEFRMYASAPDEAFALQKLFAASDDPYDGFQQFRLIATDYDGIEWAAGYTSVSLFAEPSNNQWPLQGELQNLSALATGNGVAQRSGVELLLIPPIDLPLEQWMESTTLVGAEPIRYSRKPGRQIVEVLGGSVEFSYEPDDKALWITAETNEHLQHPDLENFLTEPLRIMLGAFVYPQMSARNTGDGRAHVTFLPSPKYMPSPLGLMRPFSTNPDHSRKFWKLYGDLLTFIVKDGKADFFQSHPLTRFYEELVQANRGSRWVISLTLASTAEALAKILMARAELPRRYKPEDIQNMREYIDKWTGIEYLKKRLNASLDAAERHSPQAFMYSLAKTGLLDKEDVKAWSSIRHFVAHGGLVLPWSTKDGDEAMRRLISLVHKLTFEVIKAD